MEIITKLKGFKKPLPCLEDRKQYVRICKKCKSEYRTFAKYGQVCGACSKSARYQGVPLDLIPKKEI
jgi:protein-arginine kinase activator protein McsA